MGNVCIKIDLSLNNIWRCWFEFCKGKKSTAELENFKYYLEQNLWRLYYDLNKKTYNHGQYQKFTLQDSKRRDISVASVYDRVVHRLVYEYLVEIFDKTFIYDAWSCRDNKGLTGAIERSERFLRKYPKSFIWRADVTKFFDNVRQDILLNIISRRIKDSNALWLIKKILESYSVKKEETSYSGIPIGNLTSQIFANIYFNEYDSFIKHKIKPQFYLKYGDDFIIIAKTKKETECFRAEAITYLENKLGLKINSKNDIIIPVRKGIHFLGVEIFPTGRRLKTKIWQKAQTKLNQLNSASYYGLIKKHYPKKLNQFNWLITKIYD